MIPTNEIQPQAPMSAPTPEGEDMKPGDGDNGAREAAGLPELTPPLRADSSLDAAVAAFQDYMVRKGFRENTIKAFRNDLKIYSEYTGGEVRLLTIQTGQINQFLDWLQNARGKPCSPKTLTRRITTLKVFFSWLHGIGVIGTDPAEPVVQLSVRTPLPNILRDDEVARLRRAAQDYLFDRKSPDARPFLLVNLLLQTGMKKAECAKLEVADIDVTNPRAPQVAIRYQDENQAHKNRNLDLSPDIVPALNQYVQQYKPEALLFECTPRNLEYVLDDVGERAGIKRIQVGFETLRWTYAVQSFRMGVPEEQLRIKMGLTKISWRDTGDKIHQLTGR